MGAAMDDQRLVALAQEGNPDAFSLLVERHQTMVYNLALGKTGSPAEDPQAQAEAQERRRQLWQAIDALPEVHRTPFLLREMEGYSYREIAKALGLEEGTVKSRLARARVLLRNELLSHGNFWGREASKETKGKGGDLE